MSARFSHRLPLPKRGAYGHFTSVKWALDLPSLIDGAFDTLEVIEVFPDEMASPASPEERPEFHLQPHVLRIPPYAGIPRIQQTTAIWP